MYFQLKQLVKKITTMLSFKVTFIKKNSLKAFDDNIKNFF